jgi:glutamate/tyrosine decarboxylase-like PLP-dependent enzyme
MTPTPDVLETAARLAREYLAGVPNRPVGVPVDPAGLRAALGKPLGEEGMDPSAVITAMARAADPGLVASVGPRYFGFVIGGTLPAALAADWLVTAWDQCPGMYVLSPAGAVVEEVAGAWLLDLLGLPPSASVGFVTGCQMANFTGLAAGRHSVLAQAGWNVEDKGLIGAPRINILVGAHAHTTIFSSLRMLGLGAGTPRRVEADDQGRMRADALRRELQSTEGPTIVCAQAGEVNTGAFDPLDEIADLCRRRGAWLHVDGAFGLWAAASPARRAATKGIERADSWATDAHKWLNVPYDSGLAFVADPDAHRAALTLRADYLVSSDGGRRDATDYVPESSRRARGFPLYAALRSLGRRGVAALIDRCCGHATRMADRLRAAPGVEILNEVVLNQVLVRFRPHPLTPSPQTRRGGTHEEDDAHTRAVIDRVQSDGTCWVGGTTWRGRAAMRISVSGWNTTEADIDRSADAILQAAAG